MKNQRMKGLINKDSKTAKSKNSLIYDDKQFLQQQIN